MVKKCITAFNNKKYIEEQTKKFMDSKQMQTIQLYIPIKVTNKEKGPEYPILRNPKFTIGEKVLWFDSTHKKLKSGHISSICIEAYLEECNLTLLPNTKDETKLEYVYCDNVRYTYKVTQVEGLMGEHEIFATEAAFLRSVK